MPRCTRPFFLFILAVSTVLAVATFAAAETDRPESDSDQSLISRKAGPWPRLTLNDDPVACSGYLAAMRASFESKDPKVTLRGGLAAWRGARSLFEIEPYEEREPRGARPFVTRIPEDHRMPHYALVKADLDRDGDVDGLLFSWSEFGWRGYAYSTGVVPSPDLAILESTLLSEDPMPEEPIPGVVDLRPIGPMLLHPTFVESEDGGVFVGLPFASDDRLGAELLRVTPNGEEVVCRLAVYPRAWMDDGTEALFENVQRTLGEDRCGGTLRALDGRKAVARLARANLAVRPWALVQPNDSPAVLWRALESWSFLDPWSRRVYLEVRNAYPRALAEVEVRLVEELGVSADSPDLRSLVEELLWRTIGAHYVFGGSGERTLADATDPATAALYRDVASVADLDAVLADPGIDVRTPDYLFALVDRPILLERLVTLGANVDATNSYGKTALMYAAQLDLTETVATLIERGANVHRRTHMASDWTFCVEPQITRRTALTYAAENASFDTIRILLDAGADAGAKLGDRAVSDLIGDNPRLDDRQRADLRRRLQRD